MDLSQLVGNCHVYKAVQSTCELLPSKQAAVYAFYEAFDFSGGELIDRIDSFVTKNGRFVSLDKSEWPFSLRLRMRGNPERFKGEGRKLCEALDAQGKADVARFTVFLSILSEPLYIGKTEDLRVRFRAHHDNGFLWEMKDRFKRPPEEFVLLACFCEEHLVRVIESILIQAINPPFCDQKT
jgi:hypothetical protein